MTKTLLVSLLVACATPQHPARTSVSAPAPKPTPTAAPSATPKPELIVWSEYIDFSGHGMKGAGRFYRHDAGTWVSAWCRTSFVADPEAGPQPNPTTCDAWAPVPEPQRPLLDGLLRPGYNPIDVKCLDRVELCKQLDVPVTPP